MPSSLIELKNPLLDLDLNRGQREPSADCIVLLNSGQSKVEWSGVVLWNLHFSQVSSGKEDQGEEYELFHLLNSAFTSASTTTFCW